MASSLATRVLTSSPSTRTSSLGRLLATAPSAGAAATPALILCRLYSAKSLRPRGPAPIPLGSAQEQSEFEQLVKEAQTTPATNHPDASAPVPNEFEGNTNPMTGEVGGPKREPIRFGDWSFKGRVTDF
ncbi:putative mitochondrial protein, conserved [Modicella reniformis]|uniref:Succinate dehydrogenase assembly factor 4, mitochondrial n=1 Tax=Modicella reniformis TaxID=1440133 RepID=A0A9P6SSK6_9FUNG|nr:putative mitochondrial protein, conserved [Modicella reniformis]